MPRLPRRWLAADPFDALRRLREFLTRAPHPAAPTPLRCRPELVPLESRLVPDGRPLPYPVVYAGADAGAAPEVRAYDAVTGKLNFARTVYEPTFLGGVRVAAADLSGDGYPDLVVAPGAGGGPRVRVLDGKTGEQIPGPLGSFYAYEPTFAGGVYVAAGDADGDGRADIVTAAGTGGSSRVRVFSGKTGAVLSDFLAYEPEFRGGATVAAADLTGDGKAEVAVGAGPSGGSRVKVYSAATGKAVAGPLADFLAFDAKARTGVFVGADALAGDVDADGTLDLAVGTGPGTPGRVKVFSGKTGAVLRDLEPAGAGRAGARVALAYVDNDSFADIVVGTGPGVTSAVRVYSGKTGQLLAPPMGAYAPFGAGSATGVFVAASNDPLTAGISLARVGVPAYNQRFRFKVTLTGATVDGVDYIPAGVVTVKVRGTPTGWAWATVGSAAVETTNHALLQSGVTLPAVLPDGLYDERVEYSGDGVFEGASLENAESLTGYPLAITKATPDTGFTTGHQADRITNANNLTVTGTAPAGSTVDLYHWGVEDTVAAWSGSTTASASGTWSMASGTLSEWENGFVATATIGGSTTGISNVYVMAVDTTPPEVVVLVDDSTPETVPAIWVAAGDAYGIWPTATLDIDWNGNGTYAGAELGVAAVALVDGVGVFEGYPGLAVGSRSIRVRVSDIATNEGSASDTVTVTGSTWDNIDIFDPRRPGPLTAAYAGAVTAAHPLDLDRSPAPAGPTAAALAYASTEADARPVVRGAIRSSNALGTPSGVTATLTWDGSSAASSSTSGAGLVPGGVWAVGLQPAGNQTTGRHTYTLSVFLDYPGTADDQSFSMAGAMFVVNRSADPFGAGWGLSVQDRLVDVIASGSYPAGKLWINGSGGWSFYEDVSGTYDSPPGDPGTLAAVGGGYEYTTPDGRKWVFDSAGKMTRWVSADGAETTTYAYDGSNRLSTVAGPDGGVATFAYDGSGRVQTVTAPGPRVTTLAYTGSDLTTVTDPAGGVHTFAYDGSHRLTGQTWGAGRSAYTYASGLVASITAGSGTTWTFAPAMARGLGGVATDPLRASVVDAAGRRTDTRYDALGLPTGGFLPSGGQWAAARDSDGYVTASTDPLGRTTTLTRDSAGYVTGVQNPDGSRATYTYQSSHHALTTATDELGRTTTYTYTGAGQLQTVTDPLGGVTTLTWSGGLLQTVTDPLGRTTTAVYDAYRRLTGELSDGAPTGTLLYDSYGYSAGWTDPLGNTTTVTNDAAGHVTAVTAPTAEVTTAAYDAAGRVTGTTAPSGRRTAYAFDDAGRVTAVVEAVGSGLERRTTYAYDEAGRPVTVTDPLGNVTTTAYDGAGRAEAVTDPLGNTTRVHYDHAGRVVAAFDPLGHQSRAEYDARGRLTAAIDPLGYRTTAVYDAAGNLTAVVDPLGNRSTTVYDALDRPVAWVDPLGNRTTAVYDAASQAIASVDPLGNRTTAVYDARGRVSAVVDALGNRTTAAYDAADRLTSVLDPLGNRTTAVYDAASRPIATIDALGNRTTAVYDAAGRFSAAVDALGNRTTAVYDALDRLSAVVNALGQRTTAAYDAADRLVAVTNPLTQTTTAVYDAASRLVATIDPLGNRSTATYDAAGQVTAVTDPLGNTTRTYHDPVGRAAVVEDPLGNRTTAVYDAAGRPTAAVDPLGNRTTATYDAASRWVATVDALGNRTTATYDAAGNVTAVQNPLGHRTTAGYDALNRVVATVDALGNRATAVYDAAGNLTTAIDPLNRRTTAVYDALNRAVATIDPLGNRATAVYDAAGNVTAAVDELGRRTTAVYDALNRVAAVVDPLGNRTTTAYDAAGRVQAVTDALNHTTTLAYDGAGRVTGVTDPLGNARAATYDAAGRVRATADELGRRTTYAYDDAGRVVDTLGPSGFRTTAVYDAAGNVVAAVDPLGHRTTAGYDALNRVTAGVDALGYRTTAAYDAGGRVQSLKDASGNTTTWTYDALDRVTAEANPLGAAATFAYDAAGRLSSSTDRLGRRRDYAYDGRDRVTTLAWVVGGSTTQTQTFTYDAVGNQLTAADPDGAYTLTYDALDRVTRAAEPFGAVLTFAYDAVGNRTRVEDSFGGITTVTFDAADRQTGEEWGGSGVTRIKESRSYDAAGALDTVTRQKWSGSWQTAGTSTYAYDVVGQRPSAIAPYPSPLAGPTSPPPAGHPVGLNHPEPDPPPRNHRC